MAPDVSLFCPLSVLPFAHIASLLSIIWNVYYELGLDPAEAHLAPAYAASVSSAVVYLAQKSLVFTLQHE